MTPAGGSAEGEHVQPGGGGAGKKSDEGKKEAGLSQEALRKAAEAVQPTQSPPGTEGSVEAGYELAAALGISKEAAQQGVADCIAGTIRDAHLDADLFGSYYQAFEERVKQSAATPDEEGGEDHANPNDASSGANEAGAGGGEDDVLPPGPDALPGGAPGGPEMSLGDILGGAGGEGDLGAMPGGEPSEEEALAELAAALEELGIPIEALAEAGGGMPPEGAGGPPIGGEMPAGLETAASAGAGKQQQQLTEGQKLAAAVSAFKRSGKYQIKEASTKRARAIRDAMKGYVREIMGLT